MVALPRTMAHRAAAVTLLAAWLLCAEGVVLKHSRSVPAPTASPNADAFNFWVDYPGSPGACC